MAYCTLTDVENYITAVEIDGTTTPSAAVVGNLIVDRANEIDAALKSRGLSVPMIGPPEFVQELRVLNAKGAAADVLWQAMPAFIEGDKVESPYAQQLHDDFAARIVEIQEGVGVPVTVAVAELDLAPHSFVVDTGAYGQPNDAVTDAWGDPVRSEPTFIVGKKW